MSGAQGDVAGPAAEGAPGANGDRDSVDDVIERLLSVRGEEGVGTGEDAGGAERSGLVVVVGLAESDRERERD